MMEVMVNKYLYVRVGKPSVNAPTYQHLAPGTKLTVEEQLYDGDTYNGSNKWLRDLTGNYYWAGGVEKISLSPILKKKIDGLWWFNNYGIHDFWTVTKGEDIKIGILDTGLCRHPDLNFDHIIGGFNFINNSKDFYSDDTGHCTHLVGMIGAQGNMITGIAPQTKFWVGKVLNTSGEFNDINVLISALNYIYDQGIDLDIINLSLEIPPINYNKISSYKAQLEDVVGRIKKKYKTIFVSSIGNYGYMKDPVNALPSFANGIFSVAGIDEKDQKPYHSGFSDKIDIVAPATNIVSLFPPDTTKDWDGNSQASAFVTAIFALAKNYWMKTKPQVIFDPDQLMEIFRDTATSLGDFRICGKGRIQPHAIKSKIDTLN